MRVWHLESGRCTAVLEGHGGIVVSVAVSGDGRRAVSGAWDNTVRGWDLESGRCSAVLEGHSEVVKSVALSGDGRRADDNTVRVWDMESGRCPAVLEGHSHSVNSVALSSDGRRVVSGSFDNTVQVWDLEAGECLETHPCDSESAERAWDSVYDGLYRVPRVKGDMTIRNVETAEMIARFPEPCTDAACSPDGRYSIAGTGNGRFSCFGC